jgi:carbon-monoxide dehydrogenase large subunit
MVVGGSALVLAADKIIAKGKLLAAHMMEAAETDIEFADAKFSVAGTDRSVTLKQVASASFQQPRLPKGMPPGLIENATYAPEKATYPNGSHVCEVEVDPDTGVIDLLNYVVVDDVGTIINPLTLAGQIHGGVAQGVGQILMEEVVYDRESGQLVTASFMDYAMPRADMFPFFDTGISEVPMPGHPLGIRPAGEGGTTPALAVVVNAVVDALRDYGVRHVEMPATPERIWRAMRGKPARPHTMEMS